MQWSMQLKKQNKTNPNSHVQGEPVMVYGNDVNIGWTASLQVCETIRIKTHN